MSKLTASNLTTTRVVASVWKPTPIVATVDVQDDYECVVISTHNYEVTMTEDEIGNLFQETSQEDEIDDEGIQSHLQALRNEPSFSQTPAYAMQIWINNTCSYSGRYKCYNLI